MSIENLERFNKELSGSSAGDIVKWGFAQANGRAVVTTNFRPYEAVILHLVTQVQADIPVIWVDHGYNTPETYRFAEKVIKQLGLNVHLYLPLRTAAHREAADGPVPGIEQETAHSRFTEEVKLEPFRRAMEELKPTVWFNALRSVQNPFRANLDTVSLTPDGVLKVSPVFSWADAEMDTYLENFGLPDETIYNDPTKVLEKRECGLHLDTVRSAENSN